MLLSSDAVRQSDRTEIQHEVRPLDDIYDSYFAVKEAKDPASVLECLNIRHSVYCVENDYEDSKVQTGSYETDEYDIRAKHAALYYVRKQIPVGTVRMIYPQFDAPNESFVLQGLVDWSCRRESDFYPVMSTGEISRFCVTKDFRRRLKDMESAPAPSDTEILTDELRQVIPNMTLGLIEWLVRISVRDRLSHWCAVMEPSLLRLLARLGIHFQPIGDLVEFHRLRQPCVLEVVPMLERMHDERPDIWNVVTANGAHALAFGQRT